MLDPIRAKGYHEKLKSTGFKNSDRGVINDIEKPCDSCWWVIPHCSIQPIPEKGWSIPFFFHSISLSIRKPFLTLTPLPPSPNPSVSHFRLHQFWYQAEPRLFQFVAALLILRHYNLLIQRVLHHYWAQRVQHQYLIGR